MFTKNILLLTICLSIPTAILSQDASSLLNLDFIKQFLPTEYHGAAASGISQVQSLLGGVPTSSTSTGVAGLAGLPGDLSGLLAQVHAATANPTATPQITLPQAQMQMPAPVHSHAPIPVHHYYGPAPVPAPAPAPVPAPVPAPIAAPVNAYNPYMPRAPAPVPVPLPAPVPIAVPVPVNIPNHSHAISGGQVVQGNVSGGPVNPFMGGAKPVKVEKLTDVVLKADLNAVPVFHPPAENKVPEYPPIEGQHWYQYRIAN